MYQALYRKYRSQTFQELVGQEVVATTLKKAVASGKISHAYLFSGPRGTGKTSVAKIFAKAMNCPNQVKGEPCNQCDICQDITEGSLEDVIEIDAASNNGVDEIREIRDKSTYAPSRATYKVYIIDEVHMLSTGAFNALLKTLEEPTENVVFILATTELHKIPATILSRVQRFEFKAIKQTAIRQHIAQILNKEGIAYEDQALNLIARQAEGGMRDALSILDQALSLSADNQVTAAIAEEITGSVGQEALDNYLTNIIQHDSLAALTNLNTIFDSGKGMSRFATDLLDYLRDILMVQAGGEATRNSQAFQDNLSLEQERLFTMIDIITQTMPELKNGTQPKIYAEMMTIQLSDIQQISNPVQTGASEELEKEIQVLKREVAQLKAQLETSNFSNTDPISKSKTPTNFRFKVDKTKILTIMEETVADSEKSRQYLDALKSSWNEILDSIGPQDRALLLGSEPVLANSENAILAFQAAFNAEQAMKRTDLNTMFGNIMSQAAGFSPQIMAVPKSDFEEIRTEFAQKMRNQKDPDNSADSQDDQVEAEGQDSLIPNGFEFLSDKLEVEED
ncbi:DNA polymerase III subunit gamma/tau [Streptococcus sobrinus]|uniref:DNA-directed DNA polymerase n=3 Tax=Streptococcus sobrinus TaxID=1310 RepID=U2J4E5_9STRE|nr:DNA polymerase III subunit gamma/tau [Streptococcus sobrinus]ERJ74625.1 DNA polymerase III, subunit gamma and tau [Streptococcus sobrinus W1703]